MSLAMPTTPSQQPLDQQQQQHYQHHTQTALLDQLEATPKQQVVQPQESQSAEKSLHVMQQHRLDASSLDGPLTSPKVTASDYQFQDADEQEGEETFLLALHEDRRILAANSTAAHQATIVPVQQLPIPVEKQDELQHNLVAVASSAVSHNVAAAPTTQSPFVADEPSRVMQRGQPEHVQPHHPHLRVEQSQVQSQASSSTVKAQAAPTKPFGQPAKARSRRRTELNSDVEAQPSSGAAAAEPSVKRRRSARVTVSESSADAGPSKSTATPVRKSRSALVCEKCNHVSAEHQFFHCSSCNQRRHLSCFEEPLKLPLKGDSPLCVPCTALRAEREQISDNLPRHSGVKKYGGARQQQQQQQQRREAQLSPEEQEHSRAMKDDLGKETTTPVAAEEQKAEVKKPKAPPRDRGYEYISASAFEARFKPVPLPAKRGNRAPPPPSPFPLRKREPSVKSGGGPTPQRTASTPMSLSTSSVTPTTSLSRAFRARPSQTPAPITPSSTAVAAVAIIATTKPATVTPKSTTRAAAKAAGVTIAPLSDLDPVAVMRSTSTKRKRTTMRAASMQTKTTTATAVTEQQQQQQPETPSAAAEARWCKRKMEHASSSAVPPLTDANEKQVQAQQEQEQTQVELESSTAQVSTQLIALTPSEHVASAEVESKATAEQSERTAEQGETTAVQSETLAERSETTAEQRETTAEQRETTIEQSETPAEQSKTTAEQSEPTAERSKMTAEQSETLAERSETTAEQSETTTAQSETPAEPVPAPQEATEAEPAHAELIPESTHEPVQDPAPVELMPAPRPALKTVVEHEPVQTLKPAELMPPPPPPSVAPASAGLARFISRSATRAAVQPVARPDAHHVPRPSTSPKRGPPAPIFVPTAPPPDTLYDSPLTSPVRHFTHSAQTQPVQSRPSTPVLPHALVAREAASATVAQAQSPKTATPPRRLEPKLSGAAPLSPKHVASASLMPSPRSSTSLSLKGAVPSKGMESSKTSSPRAPTSSPILAMPQSCKRTPRPYASADDLRDVAAPARQSDAAKATGSKQVAVRASPGEVLAVVDVLNGQELQSPSSSTPPSLPSATREHAARARSMTAQPSSRPRTPRSSSATREFDLLVEPRPSQVLFNVTVTTPEAPVPPGSLQVPAPSAGVKPSVIIETPALRAATPVISLPAHGVAASDDSSLHSASVGRSATPASPRAFVVSVPVRLPTPSPVPVLAATSARQYDAPQARHSSRSVAFDEAIPSARALGKRKAAPHEEAEMAQPMKRERRLAAARADAMRTIQMSYALDLLEDAVRRSSSSSSSSSEDSSEEEEMDMETHEQERTSSATMQAFDIILPSSQSRSTARSSSIAASKLDAANGVSSLMEDADDDTAVQVREEYDAPPPTSSGSASEEHRERSCKSVSRKHDAARTSGKTKSGGQGNARPEFLALDHLIDLGPRRRIAPSKSYLTAQGSQADVDDDPDFEPNAAAFAPKKKAAVSRSSRLQKPQKRDFDEARGVHNGLAIERQVATCKHKRYSGWSRCSACRQPKLKQICRFLDMRCFYIDPKTDVPYVLPGPAEAHIDLQGTSSMSDQSAEPEFVDVDAASRSAETYGQSAGEPERRPPPPFFASETRSKAAEFKSPDMYNVPIDATSRHQIKLVAAKHLSHRLEEELAHEQLPNCLRRWRGLTEAMTCDFCSTSLFASSFFCQLCGHEFCRDCFQHLEAASEGTGPKALLKCMPSLPNHLAKHFIPVTRFEEGELETELPLMKALIAAEAGQDVANLQAPTAAVHGNGSSHTETSSSSDSAELRDAMDVDALVMQVTQEDHSLGTYPVTFSAASATASAVAPRSREGAGSSRANGTTVMPMSSSPLLHDAAASQELASFQAHAPTSAANRSSSAVPSGKQEKVRKRRIQVASHDVVTHPKDDLNEELFLETWSQGHPLVVKGVTLAKAWDPVRFINMYGDELCEITTCEDDEDVRQVFVKQFFETFGLPKAQRKALLGKGTWKLKDWPPQSAFSQEFPELNADFNDAVPMPDYTRRDGRKNVSAMFPGNANAPDLGPKMYNAWPSKLSAGGHGSTRLHMDVADAVNIMLHAAETTKQEQFRGAVWDLFRAEDSGKLRKFLRELFSIEESWLDPIHVQKYYLTEDLLAQLYAKYDVKPWRVFQQPGEAVFIPAGCAHQVCNLTDCIKVAVDFISPQNVARCFQLTEEFRDMVMEDAPSWKEDILQLQTQLWYAWLACRTYDDPVQSEKWGKPRPAIAEPAAQAKRSRVRVERVQNAVKASTDAASTATPTTSDASASAPPAEQPVSKPSATSVASPQIALVHVPKSKAKSGATSKPDPNGPAWLLKPTLPEVRARSACETTAPPVAKAKASRALKSSTAPNAKPATAVAAESASETSPSSASSSSPPLNGLAKMPVRCMGEQMVKSMLPIAPAPEHLAAQQDRRTSTRSQAHDAPAAPSSTMHSRPTAASPADNAKTLEQASATPPTPALTLQSFSNEIRAPLRHELQDSSWGPNPTPWGETDERMEPHSAPEEVDPSAWGETETDGHEEGLSTSRFSSEHHRSEPMWSAPSRSRPSAPASFPMNNVRGVSALHRPLPGRPSTDRRSYSTGPPSMSLCGSPPTPSPVEPRPITHSTWRGAASTLESQQAVFMQNFLPSNRSQSPPRHEQQYRGHEREHERFSHHLPHSSGLRERQHSDQVHARSQVPQRQPGRSRSPLSRDQEQRRQNRQSRRAGLSPSQTTLPVSPPPPASLQTPSKPHSYESSISQGPHQPSMAQLLPTDSWLNAVRHTPSGYTLWKQAFQVLPAGEQRRMREEALARQNFTPKLALDELPDEGSVWQALSLESKQEWIDLSDAVRSHNEPLFAAFRSERHERIENSLQSARTMSLSAAERHRLAEDGNSDRARSSGRLS